MPRDSFLLKGSHDTFSFVLLIISTFIFGAALGTEETDSLFQNLIERTLHYIIKLIQINEKYLPLGAVEHKMVAD